VRDPELRAWLTLETGIGGQEKKQLRTNAKGTENAEYAEKRMRVEIGVGRAIISAIDRLAS
jgi:hypothetical protein